MTYQRVLPRDAFNESKLLKCIGKLTLLIEDGLIPWLSYEFDQNNYEDAIDERSTGFRIWKNDSDGSIFITNLGIYYRDKKLLNHRIPLNSKAPWPLFFTNRNYEDLEVFDDEGNLLITEEILKEFLAIE
jgi:hypothetical protein